MKTINDFREIDKKLIEQGEIILYTTPSICWNNHFLYFSDKTSLDFDFNPFDILEVKLWWEGDRTKASKNGMILHISLTENEDLCKLISKIPYCNTEDNNINKTIIERLESYYCIKIHSKNHISFFKSEQCFLGTTTYSYFDLGNLKLCWSKKDALQESINLTYERCTEFFSLMKKMGTQQIKKNLMGKPKPIKFAYGNFKSSDDLKDIVRLRKLFLMSRKIYRQCFLDFKKAVLKHMVYHNTNFPYSVLNEISSLFDWKLFNRYVRMIYTYHNKTLIVNRKNFFKAYFKNEVLCNKKDK